MKTLLSLFPSKMGDTALSPHVDLQIKLQNTMDRGLRHTETDCQILLDGGIGSIDGGSHFFVLTENFKNDRFWDLSVFRS